MKNMSNRTYEGETVNFCSNAPAGPTCEIPISSYRLMANRNPKKGDA